MFGVAAGWRARIGAERCRMRAMAKTVASKGVQGATRPPWSVPLAVALLLAALAAAFVGYDALTKPLPDTAWGWRALAAATVVAVLAALVLTMTKRELKVDRDSITQRVGFGKPVRIRWSEPHDYYYLAVTGSSTPSVERARVQTPDGRHIDVDGAKVPGFPNAKVPALVERYSTAANLPKLEERLEAGEEVSFGALRLSRARLYIEERSHCIEGGLVLNLERGLIRVGVSGKWFPSKVAVRAVANYPCLLRVIGQITRARAPM